VHAVTFIVVLSVALPTDGHEVKYKDKDADAVHQRGLKCRSLKLRFLFLMSSVWA
jgi:hypothetical protein